jgi:hypothetical protein
MSKKFSAVPLKSLSKFIVGQGYCLSFNKQGKGFKLFNMSNDVINSFVWRFKFRNGSDSIIY